MFLKHKTICLLASSALAGFFGIVPLAQAASGSSITGLSSDGSVMLDEVYDPNTGNYVIQLTNTVTGEIQEIASPSAASYIYASDLSSDGKTVTGYYQDGTTGRISSYVWTAANGFVDLGAIDANTTEVLARAVSGDGTSVVGSAYSPNTYSQAFYWTSTTGMIGLGTLGGDYSYASDISDDSTTVVGQAFTADQHYHAFVWKAATQTMVNIDTLYEYSAASAVSNDGSVVAGSGSNNLTSGVFRWTEATGMVDIGSLGGTWTSFSAMNGDGSVLVGSAHLTGNTERHAYRYTAATSTMTDLGTLGGDYSYARDLSADGSVVIGTSNDAEAVYHGFVWTEATGMETVEEWVANQGGTIGEVTTQTADFISDDGNVIVGQTASGTTYIARTSIIDTAEFFPTVVAASNVIVQSGVGSADTIMFGAQGAPMRNLLDVGQRSVWGTIDGGYDNGDHADGGLALGDFGFGYGIADGVTARISAGVTYTDQDLDAGGDVRQRGFYLSPEVSADLGKNVYVTVGGYWGRSSIDSRRGYLAGAGTDYSDGDTNAETWGAKIRFDWLNAVTIDETAITPYIGLSYAHTKVDAFTETGGSFPVEFDGSSDHSTIARLGADFVRPLNDTVRLLAKAELDYQFESHAAATSGTIAGLPVGMSDFNLEGQDLQQFWARGGLGAEFDLGKGVASFMVNATTKGQDPTVWLRSNYTVKF
jgi:probable HAF family extracellular repeat protein